MSTVYPAEKTLAELLVARRLLTVRLRMEGLSFPIIAQIVQQQFEEKGFRLPGNWGPRRASSDCKAMLKQSREKLREGSDQLRELELQRIDALYAVVWPLAIQGQLSAVDRCLTIMKRRAELLGLDVPRAFDVSTELVVRYVNDWRNLSASAALGAGNRPTINGKVQAVGSREALEKDDSGRKRIGDGTQGGTGGPAGSESAVGSPDVRPVPSGVGRVPEGGGDTGDVQPKQDDDGDSGNSGAALVPVP